MKYDVVRNERLTGLISYINTFIKDGWQPLGGVAIRVYGEYSTVYHQAIVKYDVPQLVLDKAAIIEDFIEQVDEMSHE